MASARQAGLMTTFGTEFQEQYQFTNTIKDLGFQDAPFLSHLKTYAFGSEQLRQLAAASLGFKWHYNVFPEAKAGDNAYMEGSDAPALENFKHDTMSNFFQIFKIGYGVTGTQGVAMSGDTLDYQRDQAWVGLRKDINKALLQNAAAVKPVKNTTAGKTFGLAGLMGAHNEIDANNNDLNEGMIEDICMMMWRAGVEVTHILMNSKQSKKLNKIIDTERRTNFGNTQFLGNKIDRIDNIRGIAKGGAVNIIDFDMPENAIYFLKMDDLGFVTLRDEVDKPIPSGRDSEEYQTIIEAALWVGTPMSVGQIKNLKTT